MKLKTLARIGFGELLLRVLQLLKVLRQKVLAIGLLAHRRIDHNRNTNTWAYG